VPVWARSIHDDLHIHSVAAVKHGAGGGRLSTLPSGNSSGRGMPSWLLNRLTAHFLAAWKPTLAMCLHLLTIREGLNFSH
jgi:hypothetical protein